MSCELCGYVFTQKHRIIPGAWGGTYDPMNVVHLCPNHHIAVHFLMRWWMRSHQVTEETSDRLIAHGKDGPLWDLWTSRILDVCLERRRRVHHAAQRKAVRAVDAATASPIDGGLMQLWESLDRWKCPRGVERRVIVDEDSRQVIIALDFKHGGDGIPHIFFRSGIKESEMHGIINRVLNWTFAPRMEHRDLVDVRWCPHFLSQKP